MFPSPSPGPRAVSPHHRVVRIVVRPDQLTDVGHRFSLSARVIMSSCRRLGVASSSVQVNPSDPGLGHHDLVGPGRDRLGQGGGPVLEAIEGPPIGELVAEGRRLEQVATELAAAGAAATEADTGAWTGPDLPAIDRAARFASSLPGPFPPDPRIVDRLAGRLSVAVARSLLSRVEVVHDGLDVGGFRWPGIGNRLSPRSHSAPRSASWPRSHGADSRVLRRRTIGWLGPGRPNDPSGRPDDPTGRRGPGTGDPRERGVRAVAGALDLTADGHWIRADEIGLIDHGDGVYTVVLPGVTDLSRPSSGWNPDHRSVRDLDMAALDSARSSAVTDNRYARVVAEALGQVGVEPGARLTVVGHSYGADTALDLAADRRFNGLRYRVDHVVAAGYYSQPQLRHVPPSTDVLVLQNRRDLVIRVERVGRWAMAPMDSLAATVVGTAAISAGRSSGATVVGFTGDTRGAGHHPENYRRFVQRLGERPSSSGGDPGGPTAEVDRFLARIGAGPWGRGGRLDAVNVSVPT